MTQLELEISNPCNEHCIHCYRHCLNSKKGFLTINQTKTVLSQAKELGASEVIISGGEALLNPYWKEILALADDMQFQISLLSNGVLLDESGADFLANLKNLKEVQFSLYSLDESIHDSITRLNGSCLKTKQAITLLQQRNLPIFISIPAMQCNKNSFYEVMLWADKNNIKSCSDLFIFGTSDYKQSNLSQRLTTQDLKDFFEITMKNNGSLSYVWGTSYGQRELDNIHFYDGITSQICVSGNGAIYPSIGWYKTLGNIDTDSLCDVFYNNSLFNEIRRIKASHFKECINCENVDFCDFFCPFHHLTANNGELYKVDKDYCEFVKLRKIFANQRDNILSNTKN